MQTIKKGVLWILLAVALASTALASHHSVMQTHADKFPVFCSHPTITTVASGAWDNPSTWRENRVPAAGDDVLIGAGYTVEYGIVSDNSIDCITVDGSLKFNANTNTRLKVQNLQVMENGYLELGTEANPVGSDFVAEIIIADKPIDISMDPSQYGNGIIGFGKVVIHGAVKAPTFTRTAQEPKKGDSFILLDTSPTGWKAGDKLVIPDTRQLNPKNEIKANYKPQWEEMTIKSISGNRIELSSPLAFDHLGARDGAGKLDFQPHVGNLRRNVVIKSENPSGVRGHTLFTARADVDIRYVEFNQLGRTKFDPLDSTTFNSDGSVAHIGTNQIGRYALHMHHHIGPRQTPANGYQYTLIGNSIDGGSSYNKVKWPITIHHSHYGLIKDNVAYNWGGTGITTEDGSESNNVFDHNFVVGMVGTFLRDINDGDSATLADPFWFRGPLNYVRNNVAANGRIGYVVYTPDKINYHHPGVTDVYIPKFPGADPEVPSESLKVFVPHKSFKEFSNNEAYGAMSEGIFLWDIGDKWTKRGSQTEGEENFIKDFKVWHVYTQGIWIYYHSTLTIDGWIQRGDPKLIPVSRDLVGLHWGGSGSRRLYVKNADIQGMEFGIINRGRGAAELMILKDSYLRNSVNIKFRPWSQSPPSGKRQTFMENVKFDLLQVPGKTTTGYAIQMEYSPASSSDTNIPDLNYVFNYNNVPGDNFQVFYTVQGTQNTVGGLAPCKDTRPSILGYTCPFSGISVPPFPVLGPVGVDTSPPVISNGLPSGTLPYSTSQATMSIITSENANCRFSPTSNVPYSSMPNSFSTTGLKSHSSILLGLANGNSYRWYAKCQDSNGNSNPNDYVISFAIASGSSDSSAPIASLTNPLQGSTVAGTTAITATALDDVGVGRVEFLIDGTLKFTDTSSPYSYSWDTSNGGAHPCGGTHTHSLSVKAYDLAGNVGASPSVLVNMDDPAYCNSGVQGDINSDKIVNIFDLVLLVRDFGKTSGFNPKADMKKDGIINIFDIVELVKYYGTVLS